MLVGCVMFLRSLTVKRPVVTRMTAGSNPAGGVVQACRLMAKRTPDKGVTRVRFPLGLCARNGSRNVVRDADGPQ